MSSSCVVNQDELHVLTILHILLFYGNLNNW